VKLTTNIYDGDETIPSVSNVQFDDDLLPAGKWGISARGSNDFMTGDMLVDDIKIWKETTSLPLTISSGKKILKSDESTTISIEDDEEQTITLSDNGAGGTFSSQTVELIDGNYFSTKITYTPALTALGEIHITATSSSGDTSNLSLLISPYTPTIGFIGNSLTEAFQVGETFRAPAVVGQILGINTINKGVGASNVAEWVADNQSGTPIYTNAINAFDASGVEIIHIMHGHNDNVDAGTFYVNMTALVQKLKDHGYKHVILSYPFYAFSGYAGNVGERLISFLPKIDQIIEEFSGYVLLGDTEARNWLKDNYQNMQVDGVHLNVSGNMQIGTYWATAIKSALEYQITPTHQFT
jgi:lysophospholipase L1-like esterase